MKLPDINNAPDIASNVDGGILRIFEVMVYLQYENNPATKFNEIQLANNAFEAMSQTEIRVQKYHADDHDRKSIFFAREIKDVWNIQSRG